MNPITASRERRRWPWVAGVAILGALVAGWWFGTSRNQQAKGAMRAPTTLVVSARAESRDVPVRLRANGTVTAMQTVDLRAQVTSTIREIHFNEGQNVAKDQRLFSLDSREAEANLSKALAQIEKDKFDLATNKRNLERQQDLFRQKFISQAALDVAQNQVDTLAGQLAVDTAAAEAMRVARAYTEIRSPFAGRTGTIGVRAGSLVQPGTGTTPGAVLVTVTQIDPISVAFTLPEKELPGLQAALRAGAVPVKVTTQDAAEALTGKVTFVDNAVDSATGTIRVKADFANPQRAPVAGAIRERRARAAHAACRDGHPRAGGANRPREPLRVRGGRRQQGDAAPREARVRGGGDRGGRRHRARRARGRRGRAKPASRQRRVRVATGQRQGRARRGRRAQGPARVNFSEAFIRRPVMTILLSASAVVAGVLAYGGIPIAALPQFDTPIVQVTALLPGASPETMASSVATPLEKQFSTISEPRRDQLDLDAGPDADHARVQRRTATSTMRRSTCRRRSSAPRATCPRR